VNRGKPPWKFMKKQDFYHPCREMNSQGGQTEFCGKFFNSQTCCGIAFQQTQLGLREGSIFLFEGHLRSAERMLGVENIWHNAGGSPHWRGVGTLCISPYT